MSRRILVAVSAACLAALPWSDGCAPAAPPPRGAGNLPAIRQAMAKVKPFFTPKAKPQPGDWLESHPEPGQTFEQYIKTNPNRPTAARTTIYIQPLGKFSDTDRKLLDATADLLGRTYNLPVKTLAALDLSVIPAKARRTNSQTKHEQLLTSYILDDLLPPRRPADAVAMLALTTSDLWPGEGWNFVFGQASLTERVGVWSAARYGEPSESDAAFRLCLVRMCKVATHETGHMFGIQHCTAYECGMNGSNNLAEADRAPLAFCPECAAKIWWACGAEPAKWYGTLAEWAEQHELKNEATLWRKCQDVVAK